MNDDEVLYAISRLRRGDKFGVPRMSDLVPKTKALAQALERIAAIHMRGAMLVEISTGFNSRRDGIAMVLGNLSRLKKGTRHVIAKANGSKGGRPPKERETSKERAHKLWFDHRSFKTDPQAVRACKGWSRSALYREFGPSGRKKPGRPKNET